MSSLKPLVNIKNSQKKKAAFVVAKIPEQIDLRCQDKFSGKAIMFPLVFPKQQNRTNLSDYCSAKDMGLRCHSKPKKCMGDKDIGGNQIICFKIVTLT